LNDVQCGINSVVSEILEKKERKMRIKKLDIMNADSIRSAKTDQLIDAMLHLGSIGFNRLNEEQEKARLLIKEQLKTRSLVDHI
jgi:hypothetical protein